MKAPDKIYLNDSMTTDTIGELWSEWFDAKVSDNSIEYTRTDTFIEKAREWFDRNFHETEIPNRYGENINIVMSENGDKYSLINEFMNYMKGE